MPGTIITQFIIAIKIDIILAECFIKFFTTQAWVTIQILSLYFTAYYLYPLDGFGFAWVIAGLVYGLAEVLGSRNTEGGFIAGIVVIFRLFNVGFCRFYSVFAEVWLFYYWCWVWILWIIVWHYTAINLIFSYLMTLLNHTQWLLYPFLSHILAINLSAIIISFSIIEIAEQSDKIFQSPTERMVHERHLCGHSLSLLHCCWSIYLFHVGFV